MKQHINKAALLHVPTTQYKLIIKLECKRVTNKVRELIKSKIEKHLAALAVEGVIKGLREITPELLDRLYERAYITNDVTVSLYTYEGETFSDVEYPNSFMGGLPSKFVIVD